MDTSVGGITNTLCTIGLNSKLSGKNLPVPISDIARIVYVLLQVLPRTCIRRGSTTSPQLDSYILQ